MDHNLCGNQQYVILLSIYIFLIYFTKIQKITLYHQQPIN